MSDARHAELALTEEARETLLSKGVDVSGVELDPIEGARGYHVAAWVDEEIELEFVVTRDAPVD